MDDAQADLDFCLEGLGLRLLKKTVNFDNHHVYHFYYGDERGTPGTIWTTFPYKGRGVRVGTKGAGQITVTSFSVPERSLPFWITHLRGRAIAVEEGESRFGEAVVSVRDSSGLDFELIANAVDARAPWARGTVGADAAIRGVYGVTMTVRSPGQTLAFMTGELGFSVADEAPGRIRMAVNGGGPGRTIDIVHAADALPAVNGLGTVHHVALAVATGEDQLRIRGQLMERGHRVTEVLDRQYFTSIYFREPGGVLFEIATVNPGFAVDESLAALGRSLRLPPWEEPNRREIEAGLAKVTHR